MTGQNYNYMCKNLLLTQHSLFIIWQASLPIQWQADCDWLKGTFRGCLYGPSYPGFYEVSNDPEVLK